MAAGFRGGLIACLLSCSLQAGVLHPSDKLTDDEKIALVRDLSAEYANAKATIPRSKKPLEYGSDGSWDRKQWNEASRTSGIAARAGDKVQITKVTLEGDRIVLEINGGLKSGDHWYSHVQVGAGGTGTMPVGGYGNATAGTVINLDFHKPMENLGSAEVKRILAPLLDFDKHTATQLYSESLPPELKKAIAEKRAQVGMNRDEVMMALGHPDHKYRESKDGVESEDWIFGAPPGKIVFVTFQGAKVVKVKEEYAGLGGTTSVQ